MKPGAFLGVERSETGRRWVGPDAEADRLAAAIAREAGLPEIVATLLAARGVAPGEAAGWLDPKLRTLMPDPHVMAGMAEAAERLVRAVEAGERIAIFADYDVDGGASAALLLDWLRALGRDATLYVPDRIDEGFGPNVPAMEGLAERHSLILCVDCGTASVAPVAAARALGADVVVMDHHLAPEALPEATALVNPNRQGDASGLGHLCAAGVVFMGLVAANRILRGRGRDGPDLMAMLDLVALATVADVAPLVGLNRAFVRQGLRVMAERRRPGLVALADVAGLTAPPRAQDLGFVIGPRINAGGRVGTADLGARCLAATDPHEAAALAERLDGLNAERRDIEARVLDAALRQAEDRGTGGGLVWAAGEGWHPGVAGIVAARLKERFNRPAVVIGIQGGTGKGSGRSVAGVDLGSAVAALTREELLLAGGGHRMAAGLTVAADRLEDAMAALDARLTAAGAAEAGAADLTLTGALAPEAATAELVEMLDAVGPFGPASPAPRLALAAQVPGGARRVGKGHLQFRLGGLGCIAFAGRDGRLADFVAAAAEGRRPIHLAGRLEIDDWGGRRRAKLRLEDAAPSE